MMRGSILDLFFWLIIAAVGIISVLTTAYLFSAYSTQYTLSRGADITGNETAILASGQTAINNLVNGFALVLFLAGVAMLVLAYYIPTQPLFLPLGIVLLAIAVLVAALFSNILWQFVNEPHIVTAANNYPVLVNIVHYLPLIALGFGALLIVIMYGRPTDGGSGQYGQ